MEIKLRLGDNQFKYIVKEVISTNRFKASINEKIAMILEENLRDWDVKMILKRAYDEGFKEGFKKKNG